MIELPALLIIPLVFIAYILKGVAIFGPGIILVPLGALLIGARASQIFKINLFL